MTIDEVRQRVEHIAAVAGDPEIAHAEEDKPYADLLQSIADDVTDEAQEMAELALTVRKMGFERWHA
jgi:hypothetical protein